MFLVALSDKYAAELWQGISRTRYPLCEWRFELPTRSYHRNSVASVCGYAYFDKSMSMRSGYNIRGLVVPPPGFGE